MTTERLFEFLVLSQTLSFSGAAKKLFMTQSALSRHIVELENELGIKVLDRNTHTVRLTQSGRILASRIPQLLQKNASMLNRVRMAEGQTVGTVSIACLENSIHEQLVIFLNYFSAKYPEIEVKIDVISRTDRVAVFDTYDISISFYELQKLPTYISSALAFQTPAVLSTKESHPLAKNYHIRLEDLSGETLIMPYADEVFCSFSAMRQLAEKMTYSLNIVNVPSIESALAMVAFGNGVSILPSYVSQNSLLNVWSIDISTPGCYFNTYVYHNESLENPAAALMMNELRSFKANTDRAE